MKKLIGLMHRIAYAVLISLLGLLVCIMPGFQSFVWACKILNIIPSCVGGLIPGWGGIDVLHTSSRCDFCAPTERLVHHLAVGVPVYIAIFYVPTAVMFIRRRMAKRLHARLVE